MSRGIGRWLPFVVASALVLWALRPLLGPELLPGADVPGHLARTSFGLDEVFGRLRLDGWYPSSALGYQGFLLYGPGLAVGVGLVRLASLGVLSDAGALEVLAVAGFVALPPAMAALGRAMGLSWAASWAAGVLALGISAVSGGGFDGLLRTGLINQHLAIPLVVVALTLLVRCTAGSGWWTVLALAGTAVALGTTHAISVLFLAALAPFVLAVAAGNGRLRGARPLRPLVAGAVALGLGAFWWVPAVTHRDLQGPQTGWDFPSYGELSWEVWAGRDGLLWPLGVAVVASTVVLVAAAIAARPLRWGLLVLALAPLGLLVLAHAAQDVIGTERFVGLQAVNRGLAYFCLLALFPVGVVLAMACGLVARSLEAWAWVPATALVVVAMVAASPLVPDPPRPIPALGRVADVLADVVPDGARFAFHEGGRGSPSLGVTAPGWWLTWTSGRPGLTPFGPEYAPGSGRAFLVYDPLATGIADEWVERARQLAVTHIVVADASAASALERSGLVRAVHRDDPLTVFAITPTDDRPVGSILDVAGAEVTHAGTDRYAIDYQADAPQITSLAIGWSPKWHATLDGRAVPLAKSPDDTLEVGLPAGAHTLALTFRSDGADRIGLALTVATVVLLAVGSLLRWSARRSPTGSDQTGDGRRRASSAATR
jgi:hypothetical protein